MIRHVAITPIAKDPDLKKDLTELRFDAICHRFGYFSLHDLDLTNGTLPGLPEKDPPGLLRRIGIISEHQQRRNSPVPELLPSQDCLTWKELGMLLNQRDHRARIKKFIWDPVWSTYSAAEYLFCQFTSDYWLAVHSNAMKPLAGAPVTLEQAMGIWSLESVEKRFNHHDYTLYLHPSVDQLEGNVPQKSRNQLFYLKRSTFFPEPNSKPLPGSHWISLYNLGYVKEYHTAIATSVDDGKAIKDALDGIFDHLQILPHNPGKPTDKKQLWFWDPMTQLNILLNSSYIQLVDRTLRFQGGARRERRKRGKPTMRSKAEVEALLVKNRLNQSQKKSKAVQKSTRIETKQLMLGRRGRSKNYRKPPPVTSKVGKPNSRLPIGGAPTLISGKYTCQQVG